MSEHERRIQRIAVGFAVVAMLTAVVAVLVVATRHPEHPQPEARGAPLATRHVSAREVVKLKPETVEQVGDGVRVIDDALGKSLGIARDDTIVAISGRHVTNPTQLPAMLRDLAALAPSSLFVDLTRDHAPVLERWELDGDLEAARRAESTGAGNRGSRGPSASPPLDPLIATVVQLNSTTYEVPLATLEAWLANPRRVTIGLSAFTAGSRNGFKIVTIRPGSILDSLGIQDGDLIHGINGTEVESTDQALELIARSTQQITVDLQRKGEAIILNYLIR